MASSSGGNKKRTSPLQKLHYESYRKRARRLTNKIARLKRHIARNAKKVLRRAAKIEALTAKQASTSELVLIRTDQQAVNALKRLDY